MRLAVVGWTADTGVGRELIDAIRHLPVRSTFILEHRTGKNRLDLLSGTSVHLAKNQDLPAQMTAFLDRERPDTVITWEVPGHWGFADQWFAKGIRWVHIVHIDWFAPDYVSAWRKAVLVAPNKLCQDELASKHQLRSVLLSVPVDTERLVFKERTKVELFVSMYGQGGLENRRSLPQIIRAWAGLAKPVPPLAIRAQKMPPEPEAAALPEGVRLEIGNVLEPSDLWETGDIAIQPSRYEGLGLGLLEAQARGVPVVTTDASPMKEVAPDLLVPVARTELIRHLGRDMLSYVPSFDYLRRLIENMAGRDIVDLSRRARRRVESEYSWNVLRQRWIDLLEGKVGP